MALCLFCILLLFGGGWHMTNSAADPWLPMLLPMPLLTPLLLLS